MLEDGSEGSVAPAKPHAELWGVPTGEDEDVDEEVVGGATDGSAEEAAVAAAWGVAAASAHESASVQIV